MLTFTAGAMDNIWLYINITLIVFALITFIATIFYSQTGRLIGNKFRISFGKNGAEKEALHQKSNVSRMGILNWITQDISSGIVDLKNPHVLLERIESIIKFDAVVLSLTSKQELLEYVAVKGFRTKTINDSCFRLGESGAGRAALERKIIGLSDLRHFDYSPLFTKLLEDEGFKAYFAVPLMAGDQTIGVLEIYQRDNFFPETDWLNFMEIFAGQVAIAIHNAELMQSVKTAMLEVEDTYGATLKGWMNILELRDGDIEGHTQRVTDMALQLALEMGVKEDNLMPIVRGAMLHDIGKIDNILFKPGPLSEEEWEIMHQHPVTAYTLLKPIKYLDSAIEIPYYHHERWDGTGYPQGVAGTDIPFSARLFAVVDVWDALRSKRTYSDAWSIDKALHYIQEQSGKQFDSRVVSGFNSLVSKEAHKYLKPLHGSRPVSQINQLN
jgi:HD-GYP domain-containing protein (c-di-GMP phosphodiesterase class II)